MPYTSDTSVARRAEAARMHLEAAVGRYKSIAAAADAWGIPRPTLYNVLRGVRGISKSTAALWATRARGELDLDRLVWLRVVQDDKQGRGDKS